MDDEPELEDSDEPELLLEECLDSDSEDADAEAIVAAQFLQVEGSSRMLFLAQFCFLSQ